MRNDQLTLDFIRQIIVSELGLSDNRVNIYNQKWKIPPTSGLFVTIEYRGTPQVISSRNSKISNGLELEEHQDVNVLELVSILLFSKDLSAIQKKELAVMALHSIYSQQLQEANGFKIFRNPSIVDLSEVEASARIYRFDIELKVSAWYNNVKSAEFFNSREVEILVNDGQPSIDVKFTIPSTDPTVYPKT